MVVVNSVGSELMFSWFLCVNKHINDFLNKIGQIFVLFLNTTLLMIVLC